MKIGQLARQAQVTVETVRFYEKEGLLALPPRTAAGYREYSEEDLRRVRFTRRARDLGFTLQEIVELLALSANRQADAGAVREKASAKLENLRARIAQLQLIEQSLSTLVDECCGAQIVRQECPILSALNQE